MLSKSIATSEQVASVSLLADYLFTRMIPHLDSEGRMSGSPRTVRGIVCPLREDVSSDAIAGALRELSGVGLIVWYEIDGQQYVEFPKFKHHQRGARFDREGASRIPGSAGASTVTRDYSGSTPVVLPLSEVKGSEVKGSEEKSAGALPAIAVVRSRPARPPTPDWVALGVKDWTAAVGSCVPARFQKVLGPVVNLHGWPAVQADLSKWVKDRKARQKPCRLEWYGEEASARITAAPPPPIVDEFGCLTEYGERITRPDKVPA